jgi:hypothetical protein
MQPDKRRPLNKRYGVIYADLPWRSNPTARSESK